MKYLLTLTALVLLSATANAQLVTNCENDTIAFVASNGDIQATGGYVIGKFESNGDVKDATNALIGHIETDGTIKDASLNVIGKAQTDGTIKDENDLVIATIESNGDVKNKSIVGHATNIDYSKAASILFFFRFTE